MGSHVKVPYRLVLRFLKTINFGPGNAVASNHETRKQLGMAGLAGATHGIRVMQVGVAVLPFSPHIFSIIMES